MKGGCLVTVSKNTYAGEVTYIAVRWNLKDGQIDQALTTKSFKTLEGPKRWARSRGDRIQFDGGVK